MQGSKGRRKGWVVTLFGVIALLVGSPVFAGTWETKAPMPTARIWPAGGVIDNRLYVVGGAVGGSTNVNEVYDPGTDSWATKAPALTSWAFQVGVVIDEKLYVLGGCIGSDCRIGTTNQLEMYDPALDAWVTKSPMPTTRAQVAAAAVGGKLYVVGGFPACPPCFPQFDTLDVYDPATDTWATKSSMPTAREGPSAASIGDRLYVVGGCVRSGPSGPCPATDKLEVYDPVTDSWTTKAPMPTPRLLMGVGVINGQLHAVGGHDGSILVATHEVYDPGTDTWTTDTSMPTPRYGIVAEVINSRLYAVGGQDNTGAILNTLEVFSSILPFAAFDAKAEIQLGPLANDDEFEVKATFTLGTGSDGVDPLTEDVSFQVGTFSTTIPAGSFKQDKKGLFKFEGVIDGVALEAVIRPLVGGTDFEFKAEGANADLTGTVNPVDVALTVGDDSGSATVTAEFD